ncbi:30S ribosomal protein S17 [Candidatus Woesearchaeota archaeon]|nr:30S ribosomal protein S17P [uncultured archaeon]MBS3140876.1 30S ribosomal protein S17 [Candidatus Woesearchaeota archaeon]
MKPGIKIEKPKKECQDKRCPFHGSLRVRGRIFSGKVKKIDVFRTTTIEFPRLKFLPKYERYEKRTTRIHAHCPPCLDIKTGDKVVIGECRKLSKTKSFVVIGFEK